MARILVTGGPVHAKLDAVKIVTNRFRGGRMVALANALTYKQHVVTYLTSQYTIPPEKLRGFQGCLGIATHDGFIDYMEKVERIAPECDLIILGAAVANLVPEPPWGVDQKFPSHDYEEGDIVNVPFRVAPRVINMVKDINPRCTLVGFKLLSGVSDEELVRAAYTVITEAKADLVIANDATNLDRKLLVTKERSVIEIQDDNLSLDRGRALCDFLDELAKDEHYETQVLPDYEVPKGQPVFGVTGIMKEAVKRYRIVQEHYAPKIEEHGRDTQDGYLFGCIATRSVNDGFVCSARGKGDLSQFVHVAGVNHGLLRVTTIQGKASLNAPLLDNIFRANPRAKAIVHTHRTGTSLPKLPWAPPGTVRDSLRELPPSNFEIEHHGVFLVLEDLP